VRSIVHKLTKGEAPDTAQMNAKVREMIAAVLQADGVEDIFKLGDFGAKLAQGFTYSGSGGGALRLLLVPRRLLRPLPPRMRPGFIAPVSLQSMDHGRITPDSDLS